MGAQRLLTSILAVRALLALSLLVAAPARAEAPLLMGFYETWSEPANQPAEKTRFARLPAGIDIVALAFAKPDLDFPGGTDLKGTGLEVPFDATVMAKAISLYRRRSPETRVLLSLGGAVYDRWDRYDPTAAARLVEALGLDGIDLDYEPPNPACRPEAGSVTCESDAVWRDLVRRTRIALPRPMLLTLQAWSIGAYGAGRFIDAPPAGRHAGSMLWLARDPIAKEVDLVSITAYDAGLRFDPLEAFAAYRAIWSGPLLLGERIGADTGQGPSPTARTLKAHALKVARDANGGLMLYTIVPPSRHRPSKVALDGQAAVAIICRAWKKHGCAAD